MNKIIEFETNKKYIIYTENTLPDVEVEKIKHLISNFLNEDTAKVLLLNGVKIISVELKDKNE